jgi:hypothetical protein
MATTTFLPPNLTFQPLRTVIGQSLDLLVEPCISQRVLFCADGTISDVLGKVFGIIKNLTFSQLWQVGRRIRSEAR